MLHGQRGFGVGLQLGEALQFGQGDAGAQEALAARCRWWGIGSVGMKLLSPGPSPDTR
jgi:hypothetical protein